MKTTAILTSLTLLALVSCRLGPEYRRPDVPIPDDHRGLEGTEPPDAEAITVGDLAWFEVFGDPILQTIIEVALEQNQDVRIAAERVLQARANVTITRSDLFPEINVGGNYTYNRISENGAIPLSPTIDDDQEEWSIFGDVFWELDFWGRFRSATEAARADLLRSEFARRAVIQTLVTDLALAYFDLLLLDEQLDITRRTYESRQKSFELVSLRLEQGVANKVDYRQSESLVLQTAGLIPDIEQSIQQQENLIRFLMGGNPGVVRRGDPLVEQDRTFEVPVGLPSDLLERRPDVQAAEAGLVAANARIGEAKALLYPAIRLTGLGGLASEELGDLLESGSRIASITPSITLPFFNAGRLRSNVDITESQQREAAILYVQTLQNAFRDVADALIAREKRAEVRDWREQLEATLQDQVNLSQDRYLGGVTTYLEFLDSERDHFQSELDLAAAIRDELFAYVVLYRALGGGWIEASRVAANGPQEIPTVEGPEQEG